LVRCVSNLFKKVWSFSKCDACEKRMEQANEIALERVAKETRCKMTVDTKRLRELASRATFESSIWESEDDAPQLWIDNRENNAAWCRAANPQAIIALLDRIEKLEAQLAEANEVIFEHDKTGLYGFIKRARQYLEKWGVK
jgi:Rad3-related DNA helicase